MLDDGERDRLLEEVRLLSQRVGATQTELDEHKAEAGRLRDLLGQMTDLAKGLGGRIKRATDMCYATRGDELGRVRTLATRIADILAG